MTYNGDMTISSRNNVIRAGIVIAAGLSVLTVLAASRALSWMPEAVSRAAARTPGLFPALAARFFPPAPWAPAVSMAASLLFAMGGLILILYYFEKTAASELIFVVFFVFSLALESARIMIPLMRAWNLPGVFGVMAARALLFARSAGLFSLFAAGICAAGLDARRQANIILVIVLAGLVIALNMPLDSLSWDTSLCLQSGYNSMILIIEISAGVTGALSFVVSAHSRGSREFVTAGAGAFLAFVGRSILLRSDTWVTPLPGLLLLAAGAWLLCGQLHRVYLWL
ncbi:MAG: hypothetical protein LBC88_06085 [Spirochaetaceae bacterium]|jgi:hypothetical protein|nr:hypothetical protein [Spirochaetaceae bacterium]